MKDMKTKINWTSVCNIICAVLMLALMVCQFVVPFWSGAEGETASIQGFAWLCEEDQYDWLSDMMKDTYGREYRNEIWPMPFLCLLLSIFGIIFCAIKSQNVLMSVFPLACGIVGAYGYLIKPMYQAGNLQVLHLVLCFAISAAALGAIVAAAVKAVKKAIKSKA